MRRALLLFVTVALGITMFGVTHVIAEEPTTIFVPDENGGGSKICTVMGSGPTAVVICH